MLYNLEIESAQAAEQHKQWDKAVESYKRSLLLKPADATAAEALARIAASQRSSRNSGSAARLRQGT
jgi:hypothetical protein